MSILLSASVEQELGNLMVFQGSYRGRIGCGSDSASSNGLAEMVKVDLLDFSNSKVVQPRESLRLGTVLTEEVCLQTSGNAVAGSSAGDVGLVVFGEIVRVVALKVLEEPIAILIFPLDPHRNLRCVGRVRPWSYRRCPRPRHPARLAVQSDFNNDMYLGAVIRARLVLGKVESHVRVTFTHSVLLPDNLAALVSLAVFPGNEGHTTIVGKMPWDTRHDPNLLLELHFSDRHGPVQTSADAKGLQAWCTSPTTHASRPSGHSEDFVGVPGEDSSRLFVIDVLCSASLSLRTAHLTTSCSGRGVGILFGVGKRLQVKHGCACRLEEVREDLFGDLEVRFLSVLDVKVADREIVVRIRLLRSPVMRTRGRGGTPALRPAVLDSTSLEVFTGATAVHFREVRSVVELVDDQVNSNLLAQVGSVEGFVANILPVEVASVQKRSQTSTDLFYTLDDAICEICLSGFIVEFIPEVDWLHRKRSAIVVVREEQVLDGSECETTLAWIRR